MQYLNLILTSLPDSFFKHFNITSKKIENITMAITLYYFGLQTYKFGEKPISSTQMKNLIGREDFYIGIDEIKIVCWEIDESDFTSYLNMFAKEISQIEPDYKARLYLYNNECFILCIEEFVEYIQYRVEDIYKENSTEQEISEYTRKKGFGFEEIVFGVLYQCLPDIYHTLHYYPNDRQKIEVDIVARQNEKLLVAECKSGTLDLQNVDKDDAVKLLINNKMQKAHKSLRNVAKYIYTTSGYSFSCEEKKIEGRCEKLYLLNVPMYSADFISSNIHTLFPEYTEGCDFPILTISLEHLFALVIDNLKKKMDILDYLDKRIAYIKEYPGVQFENNELDLYYELVNENKGTMLSELKKLGMLDNMNPNGRVVGTYHDALGNETRPALMLLRQLDQYLILGIFDAGKKWYGINKRYLRNLEDFLRIDLSPNDTHLTQ
jgi:hypothetical protein